MHWAWLTGLSCTIFAASFLPLSFVSVSDLCHQLGSDNLGNTVWVQHFIPFIIIMFFFFTLKCKHFKHDI